MKDISRYKHIALSVSTKYRVGTAKIFKRGDFSPVFLWIVRGVAIFIFIVGLFSIGNAQDLINIASLQESSQEEIIIEKGVRKSEVSSAQLFLSAKLINSADAIAPKDENEFAVGGAVDPTYPTVQSGSFVAVNFPVMPDTPITERAEVIEYIVKPGDTASSIARSFGLKLETLLWSNFLRNSNYIKPGDVLSILPVDGVLYEIKSGDTLSIIAKNHKVEVADILEMNGIENETHIFAGQTVIIPGGIKPPAPRVAPSAPRYASSRVNLDGYFIRPLAGGRITQYLHPTNAVDIASRRGTSIFAAASGTVKIASNACIYERSWCNGGFGNYILIAHPNGTRTLYAHLMPGGAIVEPGQWVTKGQIIGYVGTTGRSTGYHLHWEVHGARNPLAY